MAPAEPVLDSIKHLDPYHGEYSEAREPVARPGKENLRLCKARGPL